MPLVQRKQIKAFLGGRIYIAGYAFAGGANNFSATAQLTTALATAGRSNSAVPLQTYIADTRQGVLAAGRNIVEIYNATTKQKITDASGNEVYGRIDATWTVSLFSEIAGVETAYTLVAATTLDYAVPYIFTFDSLPEDALLGVKSTYVNDDPFASGGRVAFELLTVTALNTLSALTNPYSNGVAEMYINGQMVSTLDGSFTLTGGSTAVTWVPATAGYNLQTTDIVHIRYPW